MQPDEPLSARDEIRVSEFGLLRCPSCGELAAEILGNGHCLILITVPISDESRNALPGHLREHVTEEIEAECYAGQRVQCREYDQMAAAANIALADDVCRRENLAWRAMGFPA